ncbi:hypothetical protein BSR28_05050 [Boudabousia liubingyangii]|uniref:hypothetical protein n=1 Tax=Boudabousia liubingyangii TaxID=1921764 RepID=UPI00093EA90C|nr:hypothetical protein [Boudabousia liubingyangii]OKL46808.1 hypothetical protein BSR28_05050 [Boudabousia liubingyangii]
MNLKIRSFALATIAISLSLAGCGADKDNGTNSPRATTQLSDGDQRACNLVTTVIKGSQEIQTLAQKAIDGTDRDMNNLMGKLDSMRTSATNASKYATDSILSTDTGNTAEALTGIIESITDSHGSYLFEKYSQEFRSSIQSANDRCGQLRNK